jgi:hypothetical protein
MTAAFDLRIAAPLNGLRLNASFGFEFVVHAKAI